MAKIYEFPQGAERSKLKKEIILERKKRLREKNGNPVIRHAKWFWFYLRLATAGAAVGPAGVGPVAASFGPG